MRTAAMLAVLVLVAPAAAQPGPSCGSFGRLSIGTSQVVLAGRATVRALAGMHPEEATEGETRLIVEDQGESFQLYAYDPVATLPSDLAQGARAKLAGDLGVPESALTLVVVGAHDATVVAFAVDRQALRGAVVPALVAVVVPADRHPFVVTFFVTPHIAAPGCAELARSILGTIASGPRRLDVAAREVPIGGVARIRLPNDWSVSVDQGFEVYRLERLAPLGTPRTASIVVQLLDQPPSVATPQRTEPGHLLGRPAQWAITSDSRSTTLQASLRPRADARWISVTATGRDAASVQAARVLAESIAPVD